MASNQFSLIMESMESYGVYGVYEAGWGSLAIIGTETPYAYPFPYFETRLFILKLGKELKDFRKYQVTN